jgi:hypothetical protein
MVDVSPWRPKLLAVWALETRAGSVGYRGEEGEVTGCLTDGGGSLWCPEFGAWQTDQRYGWQVGLHAAGSAAVAG